VNIKIIQKNSLHGGRQRPSRIDCGKKNKKRSSGRKNEKKKKS